MYLVSIHHVSSSVKDAIHTYQLVCEILSLCACVLGLVWALIVKQSWLFILNGILRGYLSVTVMYLSVTVTVKRDSNN